MTRLLHRFRGTRGLAERIRARHARRRESLVVDDFDRHSKFGVNLNDHIGSHIYWFGGLNLDIARVLDKELAPGMVVLDVGANVGEVALVAARRVSPGGQVFAFEPFSKARSELERNLALNPELQVHVVPLGLSDAARTADVFTNEHADIAGATNRGLASLYCQAPSRAATISQPARMRKPAEEIELTTLDAWLEDRDVERVDFIKIDVEGEELAVLKGAENTLRTRRPKLIVEVQKETCEMAGYAPEDILRFLGNLDYRFYRIRRGGRLRGIGIDDLSRFQNVLCVPG